MKLFRKDSKITPMENQLKDIKVKIEEQENVNMNIMISI